ncbi:MAG: ATP-grasp domain-containing protein [Lachnospiraceae bacterium]|nr:ATP-grasp domain-containing protein [Lachnospiraceae bacterium]
MAHFILQLYNSTLDIEQMIIKELLNKNKYLHEYQEITLSDIADSKYSNSIPIGTIDFITKWLNEHHNIKRENPIEIPKYLRTDEFLKRDYRIVTWEDIPRTGSFFLKDISELKNFSGMMNATYTDIDNLFNYVPQNKFDSTLVLSKEHLYQVSSCFNILSEYRVYVIGRKIEAIGHYNGDCTILPDIELIKKAVNIINNNEKYLKSYTLDIMVGKEGTAIIEIHNFTSVGLYNSLWGDNLLYAYKDGIDYLLNDNKEISS